MTAVDCCSNNCNKPRRVCPFTATKKRLIPVRFLEDLSREERNRLRQGPRKKQHVLFKADKQKLQGKVKARGEKKIQKQQRSPAVWKVGKAIQESRRKKRTRDKPTNKNQRLLSTTIRHCSLNLQFISFKRNYSTETKDSQLLHTAEKNRGRRTCAYVYTVHVYVHIHIHIHICTCM